MWTISFQHLKHTKCQGLSSLPIYYITNHALTKGENKRRQVKITAKFIRVLSLREKSYITLLLGVVSASHSLGSEDFPPQ